VNVDELLERGHFDDNDTIEWAAKRITELEEALRTLADDVWEWNRGVHYCSLDSLVVKARKALGEENE